MADDVSFSLLSDCCIVNFCFARLGDLAAAISRRRLESFEEEGMVLDYL